MPFVKGQSGNPLGRPKSAVAVAKHAARETSDGAEIIDFLLGIMRDPQAPKRERVQAALAILDRVAGKPMAPSEITMSIDATLGLPYPGDWSSLPPAARHAWLQDRRQRMLAGNVIDVGDS